MENKGKMLKTCIIKEKNCKSRKKVEQNTNSTYLMYLPIPSIVYHDQYYRNQQPWLCNRPPTRSEEKCVMSINMLSF